MEISGFATPEGTARYRERFAGRAAEGHFRERKGLWLSSVGIGTYLGEHDEATDERYARAGARALELGANVVDTAINYRFQRSERAVGAALHALLQQGKLARDEVVVASKAGFLTFDAAPPPDPHEYFDREYIQPGVIKPEDVVAGMHCMTPRYLADQLERSRRHPGLPAPHHPSSRVQLPSTLPSPEPLLHSTQPMEAGPVPLLEAAERLGITVFASASLLQGQGGRNLPSDLRAPPHGALE